MILKYHLSLGNILVH